VYGLAPSVRGIEPSLLSRNDRASKKQSISKQACLVWSCSAEGATYADAKSPDGLPISVAIWKHAIA
jgi:hypothetical protein